MAITKVRGSVDRNYDTTAAMISSLHIKDGDKIATLGGTVKGDGGGSEYIIQDQPTDLMLDNGLYAKKLRKSFATGTNEEIIQLVLAEGEFIFNVDDYSIHAGDGATLGGHKITPGSYSPDYTVATYSELAAYNNTSAGTTVLVLDDVSQGGGAYAYIKASATNGHWHDPIPWGRGAQGLQGPMGPSGPTGPTGETGELGPEGPAGPIGDQGPQGEIGDIGPAGATGPQGEQGLQGDAGPTGAQGPQGDQGDIGPIGPQGEQGIQGPQGIQGIKGDTGDAGQSFTVDYTVGNYAGLVTYADEPAGTSVLVIEDESQDYTSYIYFKESNATGDWSLPAPWGRGIDGEKGEKGDTGPQGPQGLQGPQGTKGETGLTGNTGPKGDPGEQGDKGLTGLTGPQGSKGNTGNTGPTGATGAQGDRGPAGAKGNTGATGAVGPKGDTGADGPQGPQGVKGTDGSDGDDGSDADWELVYSLPDPSAYPEGTVILHVDPQTSTEPPSESDGYIYSNVYSLKNESSSVLAGLVNSIVWTSCFSTPAYGGSGKYLILSASTYSGTPDGLVDFECGSGGAYIAVLQYETAVSGYQVGINAGAADVAPAVETVLKGGHYLHVGGGKYNWLTRCDVRGYDIKFTGDVDTIFNTTNYQGPSHSWLFDSGGTGAKVDHGLIPEDWDKNSTALKFPSGMSPSSGDIYMVRDNDNYSYSPYESYYKKAEFVRVSRQHSGTTWVMGGTLWDTYDSASSRLYQPYLKSVYLKDLRWESDTELGKASDDNRIYGVRVYQSFKPYMENIHVTHGLYANGITYYECFAGTQINCRSKVSLGGSAGNFSSCQDNTLINCRYEGGTSGVYMVSTDSGFARNRNNTFSGCIMSGTDWGIRQQGSTEFNTFYGCDITNGTIMGAQGTKLIACTLRMCNDPENPDSSTPYHPACYVYEPKSYNHIVMGNHIHLNGSANSKAIVQLHTQQHSDDGAYSYTPQVEGYFMFKGNSIHNDGGSSTLAVFDGNNGGSTRGYIDTSKAGIICEGNTLSGPQTTSKFNLSYSTGSPSGLGVFYCKHNVMGTISQNISGVTKKIVEDNY